MKREIKATPVFLDTTENLESQAFRERRGRREKVLKVMLDIRVQKEIEGLEVMMVFLVKKVQLVFVLISS